MTLPPPRSDRPRRVGGDEGRPEVFVADEQKDVPVDLARWSALAEAVLHEEGVRGAAELSVLFVDETSIAELNERFMEHAGPTDVLAFPIDADAVWAVHDPLASGPDRAEPDLDEIPLLLGDVVVCPAVAARNAPDHAGTIDDELALLVVHGVLHVLGYDHAEPDEAASMRARELALLEAHHWGGPAPAGFRQEQS
jgi:probable rRNA maturation factor